MIATALSLVRWAENLSPDGIIPHTSVAPDETPGKTTSDDSVVLSELPARQYALSQTTRYEKR